MRTLSSVRRRGALYGLTLGALLLAGRPASADVLLFEKDGWGFYADGRINTFFSAGVGDAVPAPTPNNNPMITDPLTGMPLPNPGHGVVGGDGGLFNAGFGSDQDVNGKYLGTRFRSGFLGSILGFGIKRQVSETTSVKGFISLWGTAQTFGRDRASDASGQSQGRGFDVREGWLSLDGRWGSFVAGRQLGILGGISTEIDYLYGHNYGLGLPCVEPYFPTCGHIGTGALGPGNGSGFVYITPPLGGLRLKVGLYDPVRLLGAWERAPYPRPEASIWLERRVSPRFMFKVQAEGMYQYLAQLGEPRTDAVWGGAAGARIEAGPLRLGVAAFHGKGLGAYVALQNSSSVFDGTSDEFRKFTGMYLQTALVFGREQFSAGIGRVMDHQLDSDKNGYLLADGTRDIGPAIGVSQLKYQTGISAAFYHRMTDNLVLAIDYLFFQADWWGARNSTYALDASGNPVAQILPGYLRAEKQVVHFLNVGATFHW